MAPNNDQLSLSEINKNMNSHHYRAIIHIASRQLLNLLKSNQSNHHIISITRRLHFTANNILNSYIKNQDIQQNNNFLKLVQFSIESNYPLQFNLLHLINLKKVLNNKISQTQDLFAIFESPKHIYNFCSDQNIISKKHISLVPAFKIFFYFEDGLLQLFNTLFSTYYYNKQKKNVQITLAILQFFKQIEQNSGLQVKKYIIFDIKLEINLILAQFYFEQQLYPDSIQYYRQAIEIINYQLIYYNKFDLESSQSKYQKKYLKKFKQLLFVIYLQSLSFEVIMNISAHFDSLLTCKWIIKNIFQNRPCELFSLIESQYQQSNILYSDYLKEQSDILHILQQIIDINHMETQQINYEGQKDEFMSFTQQMYQKFQYSNLNSNQFIITKQNQSFIKNNSHQNIKKIEKNHSNDSARDKFKDIKSLYKQMSINADDTCTSSKADSIIFKNFSSSVKSKFKTEQSKFSAGKSGFGKEANKNQKQITIQTNRITIERENFNQFLSQRQIRVPSKIVIPKPKGLDEYIQEIIEDNLEKKIKERDLFENHENINDKRQKQITHGIVEGKQRFCIPVEKTKELKNQIEIRESFDHAQSVIEGIDAALKQVESNTKGKNQKSLQIITERNQYSQLQNNKNNKFQELFGSHKSLGNIFKNLRKTIKLKSKQDSTQLEDNDENKKEQEQNNYFKKSRQQLIKFIEDQYQEGDQKNEKRESHQLSLSKSYNKLAQTTHNIHLNRQLKQQGNLLDFLTMRGRSHKNIFSKMGQIRKSQTFNHKNQH